MEPVTNSEGSQPSSAEDDGVGQPKGRIQRTSDNVRDKYTGSSAEHLFQRLGSVDVVNRGMLFAAILLLCFFPFLIVADALSGRSAVEGISRHLGLNHQAAHDLSTLFTSTTSTSNAVSGLGYLFFIVGGIAAATALQDLYERAYELQSRGMRDILRRLVWLAVLVGASWLAGWAGPHVNKGGGPVLVALLALVVITVFWWVTMWFLLAGRISWRRLLPGAVATAVFWIGMEVVFHFIFSNTIISDDKKYGAIGIVFALMSWLIAIGVVVILGAVVGIVWDERQLSFSGAFRKLRRSGRDQGTDTQAAAEQPVEERAAVGDDAAP
ncbi:MAG TPA: YhjD/YihY/BrkB family envelope integrity protein [Acidimicrobiales bacterium]|nr:YhjD/YihY/BrkB family envelope integrity protein [Acidimicrobiales bacterium]